MLGGGGKVHGRVTWKGEGGLAGGGTGFAGGGTGFAAEKIISTSGEDCPGG